MEKKKLSTDEILKAARAQAGKPEPPAAEAVATPPAAEGSSTPAPKKDTPKTGGAPKSTSDILAAARAQAAGGEQAPKAPASASAAKTGGPPKSTKDILAAARAQTGGTQAAPAAESTRAAKPAAGGAAKPAGDRPSVQEMLKAVREGKPVGPGELIVPAKPQLPAPPQRPAPPVKTRVIEPTRRNVLLMILLAPLGLFASAFSTAWTLLAAATAAFTLAMARFMMPNVLMEPPSKFKVGPPSDYPLGMVSTKWTAQFAVWIVHTVYNGRNVIYALSTVCTHLGCTPNWLEGEQKFKCPCHGSGFYPNGINFEGPAPRPLERYAIRMAEDGMLEVDRSRKFQQEMGQWNDAASYVEVT
ncbi:MAG: ubiquinol-cytochrome c reductase iron-sulfur subunit [Planctomycetaceae bacterium]